MDNELVIFRLKELINEAKLVHADLAYSLGIYFGYPECCSKEFADDILNNRNPFDRNIDGSGFIPCRKHFIEIQLGNIQLKDLINNRVCSKPFK